MTILLRMFQLATAAGEKGSTAIKAAFPVTIPVLFGYLAIGIPFGLMLVKAGYPWWLAPVMSTIMYAGAGQYIAIGLFAANAPMAGMLATMLMVNIRHIVYGLSLIGKFRDVGRWKAYLIFALTDETYALLTGVKVPANVNKGSFYGSIALLNQLYWVLGSLIGALAGSFIPFSFAGIDFALTALFAVLLINQLEQTRDPLPVCIGVAAAVIALIVFGPGNMLIVALAVAIAVLILVRGKNS